MRKLACSSLFWNKVAQFYASAKRQQTVGCWQSPRRLTNGHRQLRCSKVSVEGEVRGESSDNAVIYFWVSGLASPFVTGGPGSSVMSASWHRVILTRC
jgi:hypothetical protein